MENIGSGVRCHYLQPDQGDFITVDFSYEELGTLDSRLPIVLAALFEKVRHPTIPIQTIFTDWLSRTLQHWYNPVTLVDYSGETHNLAQVYKIERLDHQYKVARLVVSAYKLEYVDSIAYSEHTNIISVTVSYNELNNKFSGWLERYDALVALDADPGDIALQVFPKESIVVNPDVCWNDVNFN
jgi:hypothetical protein